MTMPTPGPFDEAAHRRTLDGKFANKAGVEAVGGTDMLADDDSHDRLDDERSSSERLTDSAQRLQRRIEEDRDIAVLGRKRAAHPDRVLDREARLTRRIAQRGRVAASVRAMEHVAGHSADIEQVEFRNNGPLAGLGASTAMDKDGRVRFFEDESLRDSMHELARDPSRWSEFAEWDGGDTVTLDVAKMRDHLDSPTGGRAARLVDRFHPDYDHSADR